MPKCTSRQFRRTEPSALALPQRVCAELSERRRRRTPSRSAKCAQRSSKMRRAWRCSQLCTASRICSAVACCGSARCSVAAPRRAGLSASVLNRAPTATLPARGSSTTMTVSPRKGIVAPSRQSTRAACRRSPRSCCSASLRRIHAAFSRSAASMSDCADPSRRRHAQPLGADDEADAAPARAPQFVGHQVLAEPQLALGPRMAKDGRQAAARRGRPLRQHRCGHRRRAGRFGAGAGSNRLSCDGSCPRARRVMADASRCRRRPRGRGAASRLRSRSRPRASARPARGRREAIGLPIDTSTTPGRSRNDLRGQQRAEVTAIGTHRARRWPRPAACRRAL